MSRKTLAAAVIVILAVSVLVAGTLIAAERGKLYLMTERQTLTQRAGIPCVEGQGNFCHVNYVCQEGHVAKGIIVQLDNIDGKPLPTGFGLTCADPNELYKTYEVGANGKNFSGKEYKEPCDVGFYLSGARFFTTDQKTITGVQSVCRRYWPVEERNGMNTFGFGSENLAAVCDAGKFVTGVKVSYSRSEEGGEMHTGLYSLRFYCAEMREYLGLPDSKRDPRDPKSR